MSSTSAFRTLLVTHIVIFGAGMLVGKGLNEDELNAYRSANETWGTKLRRQATKISLGVASLAVVVIAARSVSRKSA
jgi:alpha-tubulin suppressor-like RCC1 family protein